MLNQKRVNLVDFDIKDINSEYLSWLNDDEVMEYSLQNLIKHDFKTAADYIRRINESNNKIFSIITSTGNTNSGFSFESGLASYQSFINPFISL